MPKLPKSVDLLNGILPSECFQCQIEDRFAVEKWRASRAPFDFRIPCSNWCLGTAFRMALLASDMQASEMPELFDKMCVASVYTWKPDHSGWTGAHHDAFLAFVRESYDFDVMRWEDMTPECVASALAQGYYALLSTGPAIRFAEGGPKKKSGHFVFVYAYDTVKGKRVFRINNGAGFASLNSQIDFPVHEDRLREVFSGRGIMLRPRQT